MKMKQLMNEIRIEKEKGNRLKEQYRNLDRNSKNQQQHMVNMETQIRDLKQQLQKKKATNTLDE